MVGSTPKTFHRDIKPGSQMPMHRRERGGGFVSKGIPWAHTVLLANSDQSIHQENSPSCRPANILLDADGMAKMADFGQGTK